MAILMRAMVAGSVRDRDRFIADGTVDCYLDLDHAGSELLDFERVAEVAAARVRGGVATYRGLAQRAASTATGDEGQRGRREVGHQVASSPSIRCASSSSRRWTWASTPRQTPGWPVTAVDEFLTRHRVQPARRRRRDGRGTRDVMEECDLAEPVAGSDRRASRSSTVTIDRDAGTR